ncbi:T9SS type B sorting domain-containing protein [Portibacter marinus]|uniref:T9SS type B sorting domain-containing protein n=1 Tax=Portibacter marinus TaxID=2898660 RepID=UPI001F27E182|nr:gliding motility-associated C-terminal domain-containing protein [Portibacter marinus]
MKLIKLISLLFVMGLFLIPSQSKATHIVGGEITYRCLASWTFEVTLTLRRDCEFGSDEAEFDDPASIGIYDSNGELLWWLGQGGQLSIPFNQDDTLNTEFTPGCDFLGDEVCVHTSTYIDTITLPFRPGGYILAFARCCRNGTLTNILDPLTTGATFVVPITNKASIECNNSPTFDDTPALYICADEEIQEDMSATDLDGDSLVYSLCTPQVGADPINVRPQPARGYDYEEVIFANGFGLDNFMGGQPLTIDPETGMLSGRPNLVGQFLIAVCVDEYRDGEYMGTIKREFEYNVRECIEAPDASFTVENDPECDGLEVTFTNTSTEIDQYEWFFDFPNDSDDFKSTEENPTFTYPAEGFYTIKLIGTRSSDGCTSEFVKELGVFDSEIEANFDPNFIGNACFEDFIDISLVSTSVEPNPDFEIESYEWTLIGEGVDTTRNGETLRIVLPRRDSISVTLLVTSETGCTDEITQVINTNEDGITASFDPNISIISCEDEFATIQIINTSTTTNPDFPFTTIDWLFEFGEFSESATGDTVIITVPREDSIKVTLTVGSDNGCGDTVTGFIDSQTISDEDIEFISDTIRVCPGDTTFLLANPNADLTYTWTPTEGLIFDGDDTSNPRFAFAEGETMAMFELVVSDTLMCSRDAGKVVILEDMTGGAELNFSILPMCGTTIVCFTNTSTPSNLDVTFDFGTDDGMQVDSMNGMLCYNFPDFGLYSVTIMTESGCGDNTFSKTIIVPEDVSINLDQDTVRYCTGEEVNLTVNVETEGTVIEWLDEDENIIGNNTDLVYMPDGDELITVIGFNAGGCFDTATVQLIEDNFDINIEGPEVACAGEEAVISIVDNSGDNLSFVWSPESGIVGSNTGAEITVNVTEDTEFMVTVTNEDSGCTLDTSFILMISSVSAEIEADPAEVFQCNVTEIGVVEEDPDWTYEWNTGATTPSFTTDTLLETTTFSVTVTDENGCTAEASLTVNVVQAQCDETDVFFPNAFTPNGDGMNDVLKVESNFVKSMRLRIYDRWGELVFESTDVENGWNGTFNDVDLPPDVYAYILMVTCPNNLDYMLQGNITLLR